MDAIVQHRRKIVLEMHKIGCEIQRLMGKVITEELNLRIWTSCQNWEENCFNRFGSNIYAEGYKHHVSRKIMQLKSSLRETQRRIANDEQQNLEEQRRQEAAMLEMEKRKREKERKLRLDNEKRIRRQKRLEEQKRLQAQALAEKKRREEMQQRQALRQQQLDQAYLQYESRRKQMSQNYLVLLRGIKQKLTARNDPQDIPKLKFIVTAEKVLMSPAVKDLEKLRKGEVNLNKLEVPLSNLKRQFQQRQMQQRQMKQRELEKQRLQQSRAQAEAQRQVPAPKRRRKQNSKPLPVQPISHQPAPLIREPSSDSVIIVDDPDESPLVRKPPTPARGRGKGKERGRGRGRGTVPRPVSTAPTHVDNAGLQPNVSLDKAIQHKPDVDITKPEQMPLEPAQIPPAEPIEIKSSYELDVNALDDTSTPLLKYLRNGEQYDDGFALFDTVGQDVNVSKKKDAVPLKLPSVPHYEDVSALAFEALSEYNVF